MITFRLEVLKRLGHMRFETMNRLIHPNWFATQDTIYLLLYIKTTNEVRGLKLPRRMRFETSNIKQDIRGLKLQTNLVL
jgi:hypothetical protein